MSKNNLLKETYPNCPDLTKQERKEIFEFAKSMHDECVYSTGDFDEHKLSYMGTDLFELIFDLLGNWNDGMGWRHHQVFKAIQLALVENPSILDRTGFLDKKEVLESIQLMGEFFEKLNHSENMEDEIFYYALLNYPSSADFEYIKKNRKRERLERQARRDDFKAYDTAKPEGSAGLADLLKLQGELDSIRTEHASLKEKLLKIEGKGSRKNELAKAS